MRFVLIFIFSILSFSVFSQGDGVGNGGGGKIYKLQAFPYNNLLEEAKAVAIEALSIGDRVSRTLFEADVKTALLTRRALLKIKNDINLFYTEDKILSFEGINNLGYQGNSEVQAVTTCKVGKTNIGAKIILGKDNLNKDPRELAITLLQEILHHTIMSKDNCKNEYINQLAYEVFKQKISKKNKIKIIKDRENISLINGYYRLKSSEEIWKKAFPGLEETSGTNKYGKLISKKVLSETLTKINLLGPDLLNEKAIFIIDFTKSIQERRGFLVSIPEGEVIASTYVSHSILSQKNNIYRPVIFKPEAGYNQVGLSLIDKKGDTEGKEGILIKGLEESTIIQGQKDKLLVLPSCYTDDYLEQAMPTTNSHIHVEPDFYEAIKDLQSDNLAMFVYGENLQ